MELLPTSGQPVGTHRSSAPNSPRTPSPGRRGMSTRKLASVPSPITPSSRATCIPVRYTRWTDPSLVKLALDGKRFSDVKRDAEEERLLKSLRVRLDRSVAFAPGTSAAPSHLCSCVANAMHQCAREADAVWAKNEPLQSWRWAGRDALAEPAKKLGQAEATEPELAKVAVSSGCISSMDPAASVRTSTRLITARASARFSARFSARTAASDLNDEEAMARATARASARASARDARKMASARARIENAALAVEGDALEAKLKALEREAEVEARKLAKARERDLAEEQQIKMRARKAAAEARRKAALTLDSLPEAGVHQGVGPHANWMAQLSHRLFPRGLEPVERTPGEVPLEDGSGGWFQQLSNRFFAERPQLGQDRSWFTNTPTITEGEALVGGQVSSDAIARRASSSSSEGRHSAPGQHHQPIVGLPVGGMNLEFGQVSQRGLASLRRAERQIHEKKDIQDPRNAKLVEFSGQRRLKLSGLEPAAQPMHELSSSSLAWSTSHQSSLSV